MALIRDICRALEEIAPCHLAEEWDNVGLLAGDDSAACENILLTIDLTPEVLAEATEKKAELVMAYHPPLFQSASSLLANSPGTDAVVWNAIRQGVAIYSMHTALDAAVGGTNDVLAELCGAGELEPFKFTTAPSGAYKVVVFVPAEHVDAVAEAMSKAGAGVIGAYTRCSFRIPGTGTFLGDESTNPAVGQSGMYETVSEIRLEMVVPESRTPKVVAAIRQSHPYEEPAFDIYPLIPEPAPGIGRIGRLQAPCSLAELAERINANTPTSSPLIVGPANARIQRVAILVGAAGSRPLQLPLGSGDCVVTGEIRHHHALAIQRRNICALALGHWASERPVLDRLAQRLTDRLPGTQVLVSAADCDPFQPA